MDTAKGKITNWKQYNQALTQRGSLTFWMDDAAISTGTINTLQGAEVEAIPTVTQPSALGL